MATANLSKGALFPEILTKEVFGKVGGHSSLARLANASPVSFVGNKVFVFNMDDEVNLVDENGAKSSGDPSITAVTISPKKVEYGFRVSDEFMFASQEQQIEILSKFTDGFAKKVGRGLDIMAMHGFNPRTGTTAAIITNYIDQTVNSVTTTAGSEDEDVEDALALFDTSDKFDINGIIMSKAYRSALAKITTSNGAKMFPELTWSTKDNQVLNGMPVEVNNTVSYGTGNKDLAIVGDFDYFKWGFAKEIPMEIIPYGDPDNNGDLKRYNQIYIRAEAYIGWAVLNAGAFAKIVSQ